MVRTTANGTHSGVVAIIRSLKTVIWRGKWRPTGLPLFLLTSVGKRKKASKIVAIIIKNDLLASTENRHSQ